MATVTEPYIKRDPGDLWTAEDWNEVQTKIKDDIASKVGTVQQALDTHTQAPVDAAKFDHKSADEWRAELSELYIKRSELASGWGEYRRYFKQIDRQIVKDGNQIYEPAVIEHHLGRYPLVEVYELVRLFDEYSLSETIATEQPFAPDKVKFLVYYATKMDPVAENLRTEAGDWHYYGDSLQQILDQFGVAPQPDQPLDDLLNELWSHMFDPGLEQDEFSRESFGHTVYIDRWITMGKKVADLKEYWDNLRVAIRPQLLAPGIGNSLSPDVLKKFESLKIPATADQLVRVYHLSQNAVEIRVPRAMDLMVLLRT